MPQDDDDFVPSLGVRVPRKQLPPGEPEENTHRQSNTPLFSTMDQNEIIPLSRQPLTRDQVDAAAARRYGKSRMDG